MTAEPEQVSTPEKRFANRVQVSRDFRDTIPLLELPTGQKELEDYAKALAKNLKTEVLDQVFPTEIGHFFQEGQKTLGSQFVDPKFEGLRTINSVLADLVLTPKSKDDFAQSEKDPRYILYTHLQEKNKLSLEEFQGLQKVMYDAASNDEELVGMVTMHMTHDICKMDTVAHAVMAVENITSLNHDRLLAYLLNNPVLYKNIIPSFSELPYEMRDRIVRVVTTGYSRAQMLQLEATAAQFRGLRGLDAKDLRLLDAEHIGDLSGVTGGLGKVVDSMVYIGSKATGEAQQLYIEGYTEFASYNHILQFWLDRAKARVVLSEDDYRTQAGREKITLARILGVYKGDNHMWLLINNIFRAQFTPKLREGLVNGFGRHGVFDDETAVGFVYFPDFMRLKAEEPATNGGQEGYDHGVEDAMRYMANYAILAMNFFGFTKEQVTVEELAQKKRLNAEDISLFKDLLIGLDNVDDTTTVEEIIARGMNIDDKIREFQFTLFKELQILRKKLTVHITSGLEAEIVRE